MSRNLGNSVVTLHDEVPFLPEGGGEDLLCVLTPFYEVGGPSVKYVGRVMLCRTHEVLYTTGAVDHSDAINECREWADQNVVRWKVRVDEGNPLPAEAQLRQYRQFLSTLLAAHGFPHDASAVANLIMILIEVRSAAPVICRAAGNN